MVACHLDLQQHLVVVSRLGPGPGQRSERLTRDDTQIPVPLHLHQPDLRRVLPNQRASRRRTGLSGERALGKLLGLPHAGGRSRASSGAKVQKGWPRKTQVRMAADAVCLKGTSLARLFPPRSQRQDGTPMRGTARRRVLPLRCQLAAHHPLPTAHRPRPPPDSRLPLKPRPLPPEPRPSSSAPRRRLSKARRRPSRARPLPLKPRRRPCAPTPRPPPAHPTTSAPRPRPRHPRR